MVVMSPVVYIFQWIYGKKKKIVENFFFNYYHNRYQPSVRLPYIEAKIAASELLIAVLEKMNTRKHIEWNMNAVKNELRTLYQTLNQINDTLMKKLGCHVLILPTKKDLVNTQRQSNRTSQAIVSWSSKFSKMRFDSRNTSP